MAEESEDAGLRGAVRRTVGRVAGSLTEAASGITEATAEQIIGDLEPYLIAEAVPRIVEGVTPYLAETVVPEVLAGVHEHLVQHTVPEVIDGVTDHLIEVTVPQVVEGVTPILVADLLPRILTDLQPYLEEDLIPQIVEALTPRLTSVIVPQILDDLMPKIEQEIAPQLVDSLLPKIRKQVVPLILEDIVDDPSVRDLIREQSQGLVLDALESIRENIADVDNIVETLLRRLVGRTARPQPESGLELVMGATGDDARANVTLETLAERRREWQKMPLPPAPPGREFAYAGVVTRIASFAIDVTLMGWLVSQGLSALINLLESLFGTLPHWVVIALGVVAASLVPLYLALAWSFTGRSVGGFVVGTRICTADGRHPRFPRALVRAVLELIGVTLFLVTSLTSFFDDRRRTVMDIVAKTEVRFVVPREQQNRYIRDAVAARKKAARAS